MTPRPLSFQFTLDSPYPLAVNEHFAALQNASTAERARAYADPEWRAMVVKAWEQGTGFGIRWDTYTMGESAAHPELVDRRLADLAEERSTSPFDTLLDLALEEPDLALRVRMVIANDDEAEVAKLLVEEHCTIGLSDAGAHAGQLCDAPQATDLLGGWVRDRGVLSVEQAVRKLSGQQADIFGFTDRGYLRPGRLGRRRRVRPRHRGPGPHPPGPRLPGGCRAPHRRSAGGHAPRSGERHSHAGRRGAHRCHRGRTARQARTPRMTIRADDAVIIEVAINGANRSRAPPARGDRSVRGLVLRHRARQSCTTTSISSARREAAPPATSRAGSRCWRRGPRHCSTRPSTVSARWRSVTRHIAELARSGALRIGVSDPGSVNLGPRFAYVNSGSDIDYQLGLCQEFGLVPTLAIFEPGFLRAALSYWRAGRLPEGTMVRFYFGGAVPEADGGFWFGLPADAGLPRRLSRHARRLLAAMVGLGTRGRPPRFGAAPLALERGGHLRVGLEDYAGEPATNEELVTAAVALAEKAGRRLASCAETAEMLGLKGAAQ